MVFQKFSFPKCEIFAKLFFSKFLFVFALNVVGKGLDNKIAIMLANGRKKVRYLR